MKNHRKFAILVPVFALAVVTAGCTDAGRKQQAGTVVGGALGGWAGSQVGGGTGRLAATAGGALLGALLGSEVGRSMDELDRLKAQRTMQSALEVNRTGTASSWSNPDNGHTGSVTPTRTYETSSGRYCREFQQTVTIGGKTEEAYGTACRQPDGSWQIVEG